MPYVWFSDMPVVQGDDKKALHEWAAEYARQSEEAEDDLMVLILMACSALNSRDPECCKVCETARVRGHSAIADLLPALNGRRRALAEGALKMLDGSFTDDELRAFLDLQDELVGEATLP